MTTSAPNPVLKAAAPVLITAIQALQQFETDMGTNPLEWGANYPGAKLRLMGSLALQLPALANAEGGALSGFIGSTTNSWVSELRAIVAYVPPAAPAAAPSLAAAVAK
jgi:hypothetical protein